MSKQRAQSHPLIVRSAAAAAAGAGRFQNPRCLLAAPSDLTSRSSCAGDLLACGQAALPLHTRRHARCAQCAQPDLRGMQREMVGTSRQVGFEVSSKLGSDLQRQTRVMLWRSSEFATATSCAGCRSSHRSRHTFPVGQIPTCCCQAVACCCSRCRRRRRRRRRCRRRGPRDFRGRSCGGRPSVATRRPSYRPTAALPPDGPLTRHMASTLPPIHRQEGYMRAGLPDG